MIKRLERFYFQFRFYIRYLKNRFFNYEVRKHHHDYRTIPIIIISFNQFTYLKKLIEFLHDKGYRNIIIIDNNSNYKPLLKFFSEIDKSVKIHRLHTNYGHRVFWKRQDIFSKYTHGYYVITDPDVIPIEACPGDFILKFRKILDRNPQIDKVGFSLKIDNIPDYNPNKPKILEWENKYWKKTTKQGNYVAAIDTTFALYRPGNGFISYKGIRTKYPYLANHFGWNIDPKNLSEEQKYYYKSANKSASWKIDKNYSLGHKFYE